MTTTDRPRTAPGPAGAGGPASRGFIIVGVAVVLGAILLLRAGGVGFQSADSGIEISADDTTTTTAAPTTTVPTTDRAPSQVKVVVANGSEVSGLAGKTGQFLAQQGYSNSIAVDALSQVSVTTVYYSPGFESSAQAVARLLGLSSAQVQPLPDGSELTKDQPTDAGVIVVTGPEVASIVGVKTDSSSGSGSSGSGSSGSGSSGTSGSSSSGSGSSGSGSSGSGSSGSSSSGSGSSGSGSSGSGSSGSSSSGSGSSGSGSSGSGSSGSGSSGSGSSGSGSN